MKILKKIWSVLSLKYKKMAIIIFILSILATALETLGIGLVVPTITLLIDDNIFDKYPLLVKILDYFGSPSQSELIISGAVFLVLVFIIKSIFLAFFAWRQSNFIYGIKADLSYKLFNKYLNLPYEFHLDRNSSHLIRNLITEINQFSGNVIRSIIILANEVFVVFALLSLLFYFEPFGAIIIFTIASLAMFFFQFITKSRLRAWGEERQRHEGFKIQKAQEGLSGTKDLKLMGKENYFVENFDIHNFNNAQIEIKQSTLSQIPRLWLETVGVVCIGIIISISAYFSNTSKEVIPIIAVFAAAAFRIFPSSNRILSSLQSLKYASVVTDLVYKELNQQDVRIYKNTLIKFKKNINLDNVSYKYPNSSKYALLSINLNIRKGDTVGIVGSSGAGKSTLVDIILGLLEPISGKIKVDDIDINSGMRNWQSQIGYVQQSIFLTDDTFRNNIAFGLNEDQIDEEALAQAIKTAQLDEFIYSLPKGLNTYVGERGVRISGGQRQRIGIARALYYNPSILVFDEATSALDNDTEKELMESIYKMKGSKTMIIVAHRLSTIAKCDLCYRVENGQIKKVNNN